MWDLVPCPGIELGPPALGVWSLRHWTTRGVPLTTSLSGSPSRLSPALVHPAPATLASSALLTPATCTRLGVLAQAIPTAGEALLETLIFTWLGGGSHLISEESLIK